MWHQKTHVVKKSGGNGLVAVAVDKDKGSQHALRWAVENLLPKSHTVILIHVLHKSSNSGHSQVSDGNGTLLQTQQVEKINKDLFLTFRCYCTRKDVQCLDVLLEDTDIAKAITEYVAHSAIENLVFGAPSRHGFIRRFKTDVPSSASKAAPDFCTVYVISKGKISSVRNASRSAPFTSPLLGQLQRQNSHVSTHSRNSMSLREHPSFKPHTPFEDIVKGNRSPFPRRGFPGKSYADFSDSDSDSDTDISFVGFGRPSTDRNSTMILDLTDSAPNSRISNASDQNIGSMRLGIRFSDKNSLHDFSTISEDSGRTSC